MKNKFLLRMAAICMASVMALTPMTAYAMILKVGSRGTQVKQVQTALQSLGYYTYPTLTGYYGSITEAAVKRFQKDNGITADGIVGNTTLGILSAGKSSSSTSAQVFNSSTTSSNQVIKSSSTSSAQVIKLSSINTSAQYTGALDWFKQVRDIWKRGMNAVVTDVNTGKSFSVKRTYGTNHADVETLTKEDTQIMKSIWGGFSWQRRAVVVQIGNYTIAGSMTAMPHAGLDNRPEGTYVSGRSAGYGYGYNYDAIKGNGINGHMDIHFKNSRTHGTNVVQKVHQDMVKKAADYITKLESMA